jgi:hypothetical protein
VIEQLERIWNQLIDLTAVFVTPDWADPIGWLPVLLLVGVVGPLLTLLVLAWAWYAIRRPRLKVEDAELRRPAPTDASGDPVYPLGEPYSPTERMIYEPGATQSQSGEALLLACPKCQLVRPASQDTCGNCGLAFTLKTPTRSLRPAGPPPGGAAAA